MSDRAIPGDITRQPSQVAWPVLSGSMPPLADSYIPRTESGLTLADGLKPGETVVLVTADEAARALNAMGGTGKTQLAAAIAGTLWERRAVELIVWVTASSRDAVLTSYAQALGDVGVPGASGKPPAAASHFLAWLAATARPWLAVLDDLTDPAVLERLWPWGRSGRVVVTTNRPDTALQAHSPRVVEVGPFSRREGLNYLSAKLHDQPDQRTGALDLAIELDFLPIALAQAGALIAQTGVDCREYRARIAGRRQRPASQAAAPSSAAAATGALAVAFADRLPPAGLARPMLALISMLDPNGIPGAVLTSPAACAFLTRFRGSAPAGDAQARAAVHALARLGLVTVDVTSAARTVWAHELAQTAARQGLSTAECDQAARAAADAILQAWPPPGAPPAFDQALRDCTARLRQIAGVLLWTPDCHPVLLRAGQSLDSAGLTGPAMAYWQAMVDIGRPTLGASHADTIFACDRLAAACDAAGRPQDAIPMYERVLAERERGLGAAHPDTVATRNSLARAYSAAGRPGDAIRLAERALAECERTQGPEHPDTLAIRAELGQAYLGAGLRNEAVAMFERTLRGWEEVFGPRHPDTLTARADLARAYRAAGRLAEALPLYERTVAEREQVLGPDHPGTLTARGNLASAYHAADRKRDAIGGFKRTLADRERVQGPSHPDTITARGHLADAYHQTRKFKDALPLYERTLADRERVLGPDHPDTLTSRGNLAHAYHTAGRLTEALALFKTTLADCERALGPGHPLTVAARESYEAAAKT